MTKRKDVRQAKKRGVRVTCETCPHYFTLTEKAYPVLRQHALFHQRMVEQVSNTLPNDQLDTLCQALETLHSYFLSSR